MAAGLVAEPRRRASASAGMALPQPGRPGQVAVGRAPSQADSPSLALGPRRPVMAVGQFISAGRPSSI